MDNYDNCLEALVLEELGFNGDIMGQGDNQTLIVKTPLTMTKEGCKKKLLETLESRAFEAGSILKPEECLYTV